MALLRRCVANLLVFSYLWLQIAASSPYTNPVITMCNRSIYVAYGTEGHGQIVSPHQNTMSSRPCVLNITACSRCRIQLNFTELSSGPFAAAERCDYLLVSEPDYAELYRYISPLNTAAGSIYLSETRMVSIKYCGSVFNIVFTIMEKEISFHGLYPDTGFFTSLGFPRGYGPHGDTFVYRIFNDNPGGFVRLSFDDWHLSSLCQVRIFDGGKNVSVTGANSRPFVMSSGPNMTVEVTFATNVAAKYGFKARYEFVNSMSWAGKPTIVDEFYLDSNFGDQLLCNCQKYTGNGLADFLWVIPRSSLVANVSSSKLMLRLLQPTLQGDVLEIRRGNSSNGELLDWGPPRDYFEAAGVYIRLRMRCSPYRSFRAVFAWIQSASDLTSSSATYCGAPYGFRCAYTRYCLSRSLVCDGIDHCGDRSDEINCLSALSTTERIPRDCYAYFRCANDRQTVCESKRCDRVRDCFDGSDEHECHDYHPSGEVDYDPFRSYTTLATVIPLVVGTIITLVIVLAVIGFVLQHRRHRAAVNRVREMVRERSVLRPAAASDSGDEHLTAGFSDGENDASGLARCLVPSGSVVLSPPSYDDTVTFRNVGFDAASNAPPAYTETEAAKYDEPHNASSKDAGSDENAGVLPVHPPSYTTIAGELDVFPLNFASGGGTRVPCDTDTSDP